MTDTTVGILTNSELDALLRVRVTKTSIARAVESAILARLKGARCSDLTEDAR